MICGFLEGMSGEAIIFIQPKAQLIFSVEPGQRELRVFDLEGRRLPHHLKDLGIPINVCEGQGKIFITYLNESNEGILVISDAKLKWMNVFENCSLYYPNTLGVKFYGFDYVNHSKHPSRFPFLAHQFDINKGLYKVERMFKLPLEFQRSHRYPPLFWIFQFGVNKVAIVYESPYLFVLDKEYLREETGQSQNVPSFAEKIKLPIADEFKHIKMIELPEMERRETFAPKFISWKMNKTYITAAWEAEMPDQGIFLCYGEPVTKSSKVVLIEPNLTLTRFKPVKGIASAGLGRQVFTFLSTENGLWIESHELNP